MSNVQNPVLQFYLLFSCIYFFFGFFFFILEENVAFLADNL